VREQQRKRCEVVRSNEGRATVIFVLSASWLSYYYYSVKVASVGFRGEDKKISCDTVTISPDGQAAYYIANIAMGEPCEAEPGAAITDLSYRRATMECSQPPHQETPPLSTGFLSLRLSPREAEKMTLFTASCALTLWEGNLSFGVLQPRGVVKKENFFFSDPKKVV